MAVRLAITGGALAATYGVANAQTAPAAQAAATNTAGPEEIVVTGSRIAVPNQTSISPVTFVSAEAIQQTGVTRVEDLLNQLPQVFADQTSTASNGADGTASVNLRGLNAKRTLVLVNGDRLGPGDPTTGGQSDINMIPVEMIDSIEILTGGASSTYGADAVAGVVNFKLNDHYEGVKLVADLGIYQHHNDDPDGVKEAISGSGFTEAPNSVWAGAQRSLAFIAGVNTPDGNGNATLYATYRNVLSVVQNQYSYSACTLDSGFLAGPSATGGKFACGGSATSNPAVLLNAVTGNFSQLGPGGTVLPLYRLFNYGALNYFQRPDERYTAGAFLHYSFNDHATVYANTMFMDDYSVSQIAPSGDFANSGPFDCANPFMTAAERTAFGCAGGGTVGSTDPNILLLRRDEEGGDRLNSLEHMDFREVIGIKGKIDDVWSYDASWQYSLVNLTSVVDNYFSTIKLNNALNVVSVGGVPTCTVTVSTGAACVPYNLFETGPVTPAMLNYLYTPGITVGRITQTDAIANFTGDLGKYGLQLPTAKSGLAVNFGAEYRDARSSVQNDEEVLTGDLAGTGGPLPDVAGGLIAREGFIEGRIPLAEDLPGAQAVNLEAGYRYSSYNLGFETNTYKIGLDWAPVQDIRLRGGFARAVRAPNVVELFAPSAVGLDGTYATDPCGGPTPAYTAAQCAKTGVSAAQYGHIAENPAGQYNGLLGGNTALVPETALTTTAGIGWTPSFVPNFRMQVDYYNIKITNVIQSIGGATILGSCATAGLDCALIHRAPGTGTLWATNNGFIVDNDQNTGLLEERGMDVDVGYRLDMAAMGKILFGLQGTYIDSYTESPIANNSSFQFNCAGLYGPVCSSPTSGAGAPLSRWRHRFTATWQTPWQAAEVSLAWRYYGSVRLELLSDNPNLASTGTIASGAISNTDANLPSVNYFDLTAAIKVADKVQLRLGCNNLFDKDPPIVGSTDIAAPPVGNGNTFPGYYDSLGRFMFAELTAQF
jgi:outer membrane receptor protein involved in Fe transport